MSIPHVEVGSNLASAVPGLPADLAAPHLFMVCTRLAFVSYRPVVPHVQVYNILHTRLNCGARVSRCRVERLARRRLCKLPAQRVLPAAAADH